MTTPTPLSFAHWLNGVADQLRASADPFTDETKTGMFRDHRCWKCNDGERACCQGSPSNCDYPRARND